jgi:PAS domain-containing protein
MGVEREMNPDALAILYQESRFLQSLMEHFPDRIYYKDLNSRFLSGSQSFVRMCNLNSVSELKGLTDFDLFTEEHARAASRMNRKSYELGNPS